jgi:hypothetical protein
LCHQLYLIFQRAAFHPRCIKRFPPDRPQNRHSPRRLRFLHCVHHHHHLGPFALPQSPVGGEMTKGIKNREQLARASNKKWDPATGRFTRAPDSVVLRRPSAASAGVGGSIPDVPPGFERVTPNRTHAGSLTLTPGKPKVRFHYSC